MLAVALTGAVIDYVCLRDSDALALERATEPFETLALWAGVRVTSFVWSAFGLPRSLILSMGAVSSVSCRHQHDAEYAYPTEPFGEEKPEANSG